MKALILRLLARLHREDIQRRGFPEYLTRWTLLGRLKSAGGTGPRLLLHLFHRGDVEPYFHDHPWPFVSVILAGGYWEHTAAGRRWYGPLRVLVRPALWRHRVELPPGRKCWTLVLAGWRCRPWGFICPEGKGWIHWREHAVNEARGGAGCG